MNIAERKFVYLAVFIAGMTALAVEISASRLIGSVYGNSNLVWASIIGLILIFLAVGYWLGGSLADRHPSPIWMYQLLGWGGFSTGLIPLVSQPILRYAAQAFDELNLGVLFGSFSVVLVLFSVPVTLLGMISPFAIRLLVEDRQSSGKTAGKLYALSTLGSFLGAFLPVLITIPLIGTYRTFYSLGLVVCLTSLVGAWRHKWTLRVLFGSMSLCLLLCIIYLGSRPLKSSLGQIYEGESAYNYIQVLERSGYRYLRLNEGQGIHSMWHESELFYGGPWEQFLAAPFFNLAPDGGVYEPSNVRRIAIIGLAAGTTARQATRVFGPIPIDGYEIDPMVIRIGQEYFGMTLTNLNAIAQDGRWGIAHSPYRYQLIVVDAYLPPYIPWHLTTVEFFQILFERLTEDGVVAVNVGRAPKDRRLIEGFVGTLKVVFPSVYVMDLPGTFNSILYATKSPTRVENFYRNLLAFYQREDIHPLLIEVMQRFVLYQQPLPQSKLVFTDDRAPIEWMTNLLMINFLLSGEVESLQ
ncbi:MAG: fused MFS/spermidine synthase [Anaerolineales bacterium]|nr:fused MFS/spermidine synthase [Anaerolineales bacterium]MCS7248548.1 fused MFS/spermidine synthase [Anaerolineales bacterium]MDW8162361.1 fused MFS/spermidine synthase [Anaerolineales bacterium]MDW8447828.1 fused MFS/spermidine synthase [Anaerolineales bacterium]